MTFADFFKMLVTEIEQHLLKVVIGFLLMLAGWYIGHWRARANWSKREFYDRLNFSLNWIENGTLKLRTLSERHCEEVFLNKPATEVVLQAARAGTEANPILALPEKDYWYYLNSVLNELSEQFALGHLKNSLGQPVASDIYVLCLTCEAAADLRMRKIRAMVIQKSLLTNLPAASPKLEKPHHHIRWKTLNFMASEYQKRPYQFLELELSV